MSLPNEGVDVWATTAAGNKAMVTIPQIKTGDRIMLNPLAKCGH
jgi:hypothetical protein